MPTFQSCWAMDNVLIVNLHDLPTRLHEDFDPVDPSKWLFFPGANIRVINAHITCHIIFDVLPNIKQIIS